MKKLLLTLLLVSGTAQAASTYYTGMYQSPQTRYGTAYQPGRPSVVQPQMQQIPRVATRSGFPTNPTTVSAAHTVPKSGFVIDAAIGHELAYWNFSMATAGSVLHFDNINWNTLTANAQYYFGSAFPMRIDAGVKLGMQFGDSTMIDDDISSGGWVRFPVLDSGDAETGDYIFGNAISTGTSSGGSMLGYNIGIGLTDFFVARNLKITPSIGYRNHSFKLKTDNTFGVSFDTGYCQLAHGMDELQCLPALVEIYPDGSYGLIWGTDNPIGAGATNISTEHTYYFQQPGTTHSYEVSWAGPYIAADLEYEINDNNVIGGRIELGMPGYNAVGDQPYRVDWQHPKSVEDDKGMFGALHVGLSGDWATRINDRLMFTLGVVFDYYTVSGATAKTYFNRDWHINMFTQMYDTTGWTATEIEQEAMGEFGLENCPNWVCTVDSEIKSIYKSLGVKAGLRIKF